MSGICKLVEYKPLPHANQASFKYLSSPPCPQPLLHTSISAAPCVLNPGFIQVSQQPPVSPTKASFKYLNSPHLPNQASFKYLNSPPFTQRRLHSSISAAPRLPNPGFIQVSQQPQVYQTQASFKYLSSPLFTQPRLHSSISAAPVSPTQALFKYLSSPPFSQPRLH